MAQLLTIDTMHSKKLKFIEAVKEKHGVAKPMLSFTEIRVEAFLDNSKNSYKIKLKDVGAKISDLERRLDNGQMFCPYYYAVRVQKGVKDGGSSTELDGNFPLFTYADRNYFNGTDGTNFEFTALEKVWAGKLSVSKSGNDIVRELPTDVLKYVPQTQYTPAAVAGTPNDVYPQYGPSLPERGYQPMHNDMVLIGDDDNNAVFDLGPGNITLIAGTDTNLSNKVVISLLGWLYYGDDFGKSPGYCSTL